MKRVNCAAFASGMTGCGKSQLLHDLYSSRHPRRITYDPVGDTLERNPSAVSVRTAADFWRHLRMAQSQRAERWHFVVWGDPREMVAIFDRLAPETAAPNERTLSRALGGVLFECGEIDTLAANAATPLSVAIRSRWQRGRHHLLSFAVATQAPALVSRIVTANSHDLYVFAHAEQTSLDYFRATIGERAARVIAQLEQFAYLHYHKGDPFATRYSTRERRGKIERQAVEKVPLLVRPD